MTRLRVPSANLAIWLAGYLVILSPASVVAQTPPVPPLAKTEVAAGASMQIDLGEHTGYSPAETTRTAFGAWADLSTPLSRRLMFHLGADQSLVNPEITFRKPGSAGYINRVSRRETQVAVLFGFRPSLARAVTVELIAGFGAVFATQTAALTFTGASDSRKGMTLPQDRPTAMAPIFVGGVDVSAPFSPRVSFVIRLRSRAAIFSDDDRADFGGGWLSLTPSFGVVIR
jgi:hypothetical protein